MSDKFFLQEHAPYARGHYGQKNAQLSTIGGSGGRFVQKFAGNIRSGLSRPSSPTPESPFVLSCCFFRVPMSWVYMGPAKVLRGSSGDGPVVQSHFDFFGDFLANPLRYQNRGYF